jgi:hypothetical protein
MNSHVCGYLIVYGILSDSRRGKAYAKNVKRPWGHGASFNLTQRWKAKPWIVLPIVVLGLVAWHGLLCRVPLMASCIVLAVSSFLYDGGQEEAASSGVPQWSEGGRE